MFAEEDTTALPNDGVSPTTSANILEYRVIAEEDIK